MSDLEFFYLLFIHLEEREYQTAHWDRRKRQIKIDESAYPTVPFDSALIYWKGVL